jgi:hypothetical protein
MRKMHSVSDEKFDELFKDKLYSLELEPTDAVWSGINEQLNNAPKERSFPILRLAAASLAAMVGLGMWLAAHNEPMKLRADATASVVVKDVPPAPAEVTVRQPEARDVESTGAAAKQMSPVKLSKYRDGGSSEVIKASSTTLSADTNNAGDAPAIAASPASEPVKTQVTWNSRTSSQEPVLALAEPATEVEEQTELQSKSKKIKSVGGLVNFVVSKVDKRKDKLIEFEDSEEGTMVSGVNLGLLKFKAKN